MVTSVDTRWKLLIVSVDGRPIGILGVLVVLLDESRGMSTFILHTK